MPFSASRALRVAMSYALRTASAGAGRPEKRAAAPMRHRDCQILEGDVGPEPRLERRQLVPTTAPAAAAGEDVGLKRGARRLGYAALKQAVNKMGTKKMVSRET